MSRPTPEQRAEWRLDAQDDIQPDFLKEVRQDLTRANGRILTLLDALEEADKMEDQARARTPAS